MSIRLVALYIYIAVLLAYAWKDWFKSLCGLILLMAVIEHEDMPKTMFGIQGLNIWNILFLGIFLAWLVTRHRENLKWDMPRLLNVLLLMYLGVILFGFFRAFYDRSYIEYYPTKSLVSEELLNTVKWVLPGLLLFDGCRNRKQVLMVIACLLIMYFLVAVQVVKRIPPSALFSGASVMRYRRICEDIGYSAVDMSVFLAGTFWAVIATLQMFANKKHKAFVIAAAGIVGYGQALTGGRAGYLAWGMTGLTLCLVKWRKYLLFAPIVIILLPIVFPGAVERMFMGSEATDVSGEATIDAYAMTSGRMLIWPYVIDKIGGSPFVGYGRLAMVRTGLATQLMEELSESFPHPHNMYLETLLDNGILGSIPIFIYWLLLLIYAGILFRSSNRLCSTVGGICLSFMLAQLFAGVGSQHFYPRESTFGLWAAMFLLLRVYLEQKRAQMNTIAVEDDWNRQLLRQSVASVCIDETVGK